MTWGKTQRTQVVLAAGSFGIGAFLGLLLTASFAQQWDWQFNTVAILVAAGATFFLLPRWPRAGRHTTPYIAALLLACLFLGVLAAHSLLSRT